MYEEGARHQIAGCDNEEGAWHKEEPDVPGTKSRT